MTTNKLLAGVAFAALLAGAAQAQTVVNPVGGAGEFDGQTFASEVNGTLDGNVRLNLGLDGEFAAVGAGAVVQVDFTLTNATFDGIVPANAWTAAGDPDCDFGQPVLGGGAGSSTVRFQNVNQINECDPALGAAGDPDTGFINLPIVVTNNGDPVSINVTFTATVDGGLYTGADIDIDLADFAPAFDFTIAAGAPGSGLFDVTGDDYIGAAPIGTLALAAFPAGIEVDTGVALGDATDIAVDAELDITFPGGVVGIDETNVALAGTPCGQGAAPNDNVFTCAIGAAALDVLVGAPAIPVTIDDDASALTVITVQTPSATLTVDGGANTVAGAGPTDLAEIEIDDGLDVNNLANTTFAWVRIGSGGTESNFRAQFASNAAAAAVQEVRVAVAAGNGVSAQTVTLLPGDADTGFQVKDATVTFNSRALGAAAGESGNADIIDVEVQHDEIALTAGAANAAPLLRQLVNRSPASFVATPGLE